MLPSELCYESGPRAVDGAIRRCFSQVLPEIRFDDTVLLAGETPHGRASHCVLFPEEQGEEPSQRSYA